MFVCLWGQSSCEKCRVVGGSRVVGVVTTTTTTTTTTWNSIGQAHAKDAIYFGYYAFRLSTHLLLNIAQPCGVCFLCVVWADGSAQ